MIMVMVAYHVTRKRVLPKILRQGLTPRCQSRTRYYPDRVYVFTDINMARDFLQTKVDITETEVNEWVILEVEVQLQLGLHNDPHYKNSYFTYNTISPTSIKVVR